MRNGGVGPGGTVAIVGAGPIGLAAVVAARLYSPASIAVIDPDTGRLDAAKLVGADVTLTPGPVAPTEP